VEYSAESRVRTLRFATAASYASSAPVETERLCGKRRARPRKTTALDLVDIEQLIKRCDLWPWHKQFRVDDQIDMQRSPLAAQLKLLNCPVVPRTCRVDAVNPHIGVNQYPCTAIVARETSGDHGAGLRQRRLRREGSP
jgi:hypothetical protein